MTNIKNKEHPAFILQSDYYRIYWGTGRIDGSNILFMDGLSFSKVTDLIGKEAEAKIVSDNAPPEVKGVAGVLTGFIKTKLFLKVFSKLKQMPATVTLEKYDGTLFTWRNTGELLVNIPGNIASDLMVSHLLKRAERSRIYINLSCSKNELLTVDGGRVYKVEKMDSKKFDVFWNNSPNTEQVVNE